MNRPLLVTDCDEVILHMVAPFGDWLDEEHAIIFEYDTGDFTRALRHRQSGDYVEVEKIWPLLRSFFQTEMHRQKPIAGVLAAFAKIEAVADIVILTNIQEQERAAREAHLATLGIPYPVYTNQGGKADPMRRIIEHYTPSTVVFVDDLPHQIESVSTGVANVHCLHLVGEPKLAPFVKPSPHAHARIDDWHSATDWIMDKFIAGAKHAA
jgi:hypothetical protein